MLHNEKLLLRFEGVDTLAEIYYQWQMDRFYNEHASYLGV